MLFFIKIYLSSLLSRKTRNGFKWVIHRDRDERLGLLWLTPLRGHIFIALFPLLFDWEVTAGVLSTLWLLSKSDRIYLLTANLLSILNILDAHAYSFQFLIHVIYFRGLLFKQVHILFTIFTITDCQRLCNSEKWHIEQSPFMISLKEQRVTWQYQYAVRVIWKGILWAT